MSWKLVFTRQAQRDAKKLQAAGLRPRAEKLLDLLKENPFCTPPPFEKLLGYVRPLGYRSPRVSIDKGRSQWIMRLR